MEVVVSAVVGLIAGAIGSLIAPWVHWTIEKRRERLKHRREIIQNWRKSIDEFDFDSDNFGNTSTYAAMRPHMRKEIITKFEAQRTVYVTPDGGRGDKLFKQWALDEVARIEQEWGLL